MKRLIKAIPAAIILAIPALVFASTWSIDPDHSNMGFKVRHMTISNVRGEFAKFSGVVDLDERDPTKLKVNATIDTASIDTGVAERDEHLRTAEFFDVARYPTMTFVSGKVIKAGDGKLKVYGDLTLHGVTKEVTLDVEGLSTEIKDPTGAFRRGATVTTAINRKDFGMTWNALLDNGGVMIDDEVAITLEVELVKK